MNPEAFIGGNINLLKAGYTLRLAERRRRASDLEAEAVSEVAAQNQAWQAIVAAKVSRVAPTCHCARRREPGACRAGRRDDDQARAKAPSRSRR